MAGNCALNFVVFASEGATVVFCARNKEQGDRLQAEVNALGA